MFKIKPGMMFGGLALLLGALSDYFNGKQMETEVREAVNEELTRLGYLKPDADK